MKKIAGLFVTIGIALIIASYSCIRKGFDYKENYRNIDDRPSLSVNAYVGGDAYNYIINGTYFSGFMALGGAAGLGTIILICAGANLYAYYV